MGRDFNGRRFHFVGLGGAGMSGLAIVARQLGAEVTGSDRGDSAYLARVRDAGVTPARGHDAANVPAGGDVELVVSTAIPEDNPERVAGRERGLRELHRSELLAELTRLRRTIAVAGAHGKTTTSSMIAHALLQLGADPGYLIGGVLSTTGTNAAWGTGEWLVVEADESDRSFLRIDADVAVVTNVELDHHATYASRLELDDAFREFLAGAGVAVLPAAEPDVLALRGRGQVETFDGWDGPQLAVPGEHNRRNAAAALAACRLAGVEPASAAEQLATFQGAGRRFETLGTTASGAVVVDDYAHHPTEVAATIEAARSQQPRRVVVVFQPHLFSRTAHLGRAFGAALAAADVVVVLDVYPARERAEDFPGVTGLRIAEAAVDAGGGCPVHWLPTFDDAEPVVRGLLREGDLCLVIGAGDVDALGRRLVSP
jgi:UDP-N-acetylmuramate--alanine ligase